MTKFDQLCGCLQEDQSARNQKPTTHCNETKHKTKTEKKQTNNIFSALRFNVFMFKVLPYLEEIKTKISLSECTHSFLHLSFIFYLHLLHDYGSDAETTKQSDDKTCLLLETFLHGVIAWDALPMLIPTLMRRKKNLKNPNTSETRPRNRLSRNQSHRRVSNFRDYLIILTFH